VRSGKGKWGGKRVRSLLHIEVQGKASENLKIKKRPGGDVMEKGRHLDSKGKKEKLEGVFQEGHQYRCRQKKRKIQKSKEKKYP